MHEVTHFGEIVLLVSAALSVALLSSRLSERLRVPTAAFFLLAAAVDLRLWPGSGTRFRSATSSGSPWSP